MKTKIMNGLRARREAITNETTTAREVAEANAGDAPVDAAEDGWVKLSPYGVFPGSRPGRMQHFTATEANAIVAEFNSIRGRLGRMFRGVPVYIGHPDQNPDLYTDHRRLGKIIAVAACADGLWGEVEWNALGRENQTEGYWVYPSPRWDAPAGRNEFRPDRLISVGLTNSPRIPLSEPITNAQEPEDPETQDANKKNDTNNTTTEMDRKLLCEKLSLDVTATDEEIMAKIDSLQEAADSATAASEAAMTAENAAAAATEEKEKLACSLSAAEMQLQVARENHANQLLDTAEADGRISKADRPAWLTRLTGETRETEANHLAGIQARLNTQSLDVSASRVKIGDEKCRRETIANAVDALMRTQGLSYADAWNAAKKDPALQPVFAAMQTPG